mmetsp:Transcript_63457/g.112836  ORF Transcript_63457/g.112836 Transcript_63457/m.112836 type:complete len:748 (-) Transcript_63457:181-2424(-)
MGKNRPPRKVRELLIDLEKRKVELTGGCLNDENTAQKAEIAKTVEELDQLILCKPDDYESFELRAQQVLQSCADILAPSSVPGKSEAWRGVCDARTEMHATLREAANIDAEASARCKRWQRSKEEETCKTQSKDHGRVPIMPELSLAFMREAACGKKAFASPSLPARLPKNRSSSAPAGQLRAGVVLWIRQFDLRMHDNPALVYAASLNLPVYPTFVWSEEEDAALGKWRVGGTAAALWLHQALACLNASYQKWYGHRIFFISGKSTAQVLLDFVHKVGATKVVTSKAFDVAGRAVEGDVRQHLQARAVALKSFNSFLLNDIDEISLDMTDRKGAFGTFVPFLFACNSQPSPPKPQHEPEALLDPCITELSESSDLAELGICKLPLRKDGSVHDWSAQIIQSWDFTEAGALAAFRSFISKGGGLSRYESERHLADASAVARISPYLRFGMLSCRTVYWEAQAAGAKDLAKTFWQRLVWRDLAYWQMRLFPSMTEEPIRSHYAGQTWNTDRTALNLWRKGRTGYPLVDAGMRELWSTGWMTQNVRMVVAIFLVEFLNISWVRGAEWFHHTLVDADPAINPMMWQNAGKTGVDQWNFTMHPAEFGRRMDPSGDYVRRWCPELRSLPPRFIHCPWEAPERLQKYLPKDVYPERAIEDLEAAAEVSRKEIRAQRARRRDRNDDNGYDLIMLPAGSTRAHDGQLTRLFTKKDYRIPLRLKEYDDSRSAAGYQPERRHDGFHAVLGDFMQKQT